MFYEEGKGALTNLGALLLPSAAVVLFDLLNLRMDAPTAAGLTFLAAIVVAYFFFPRMRVRAGRVVLAFALAVAVGAAMALVL
jgi:hypothetical protein